MPHDHCTAVVYNLKNNNHFIMLNVNSRKNEAKKNCIILLRTGTVGQFFLLIERLREKKRFARQLTFGVVYNSTRSCNSKQCRRRQIRYKPQNACDIQIKNWQFEMCLECSWSARDYYRQHKNCFFFLLLFFCYFQDHVFGLNF